MTKFIAEINDKISNSTSERYKGYMKKNDYSKIFEGYTYFDNDLTSNTIENETITKVSTNTKGNKQEKQEIYETQSFGNIFQIQIMIKFMLHHYKNLLNLQYQIINGRKV